MEYLDETAICMRSKQCVAYKKYCSLCQFLRYIPLIFFFFFFFFPHYLNVCHNSVTNHMEYLDETLLLCVLFVQRQSFSTFIYSNVYEVKIIFHLQKQLLSLSQFLSYFPLTIFFFQ